MTRMRNIPLSAALPLALCLLAAGPASAQSTQPQPQPQPTPMQSPPSTPTNAPPGSSDAPPFGELDTNHDGKLSRSEIPRNVEALKQLRAHFNEADRNGNGSLEPDEYAAYTASRTQSGL
jgi:hypothetical protein